MRATARWRAPRESRTAPTTASIVVEQYANRVHKLTPDGKTITTWGESGDGPGQFNLPWGATVDADGDVYIADWRNDRIQKFTADGEFIAAYGGPGDGEGQFHRPSSVAVTRDGLICVADWGNERVQVLDHERRVQADAHRRGHAVQVGQRSGSTSIRMNSERETAPTWPSRTCRSTYRRRSTPHRRPNRYSGAPSPSPSTPKTAST